MLQPLVIYASIAEWISLKLFSILLNQGFKLS